MPALLHPHLQTLAAPPLSLRPWHEDDAPALHAAVQESLDEVGRWLPWCHAGYDLEEARKWIALCKQHWHDAEH